MAIPELNLTMITQGTVQEQSWKILSLEDLRNQIRLDIKKQDLRSLNRTKSSKLIIHGSGGLSHGPQKQRLLTSGLIKKNFYFFTADGLDKIGVVSLSRKGSWKVSYLGSEKADALTFVRSGKFFFGANFQKRRFFSLKDDHAVSFDPIEQFGFSLSPLTKITSRYGLLCVSLPEKKLAVFRDLKPNRDYQTLDLITAIPVDCIIQQVLILSPTMLLILGKNGFLGLYAQTTKSKLSSSSPSHILEQPASRPTSSNQTSQISKKLRCWKLVSKLDLRLGEGYTSQQISSSLDHKSIAVVGYSHHRSSQILSICKVDAKMELQLLNQTKTSKNLILTRNLKFKSFSLTF